MTRKTYYINPPAYEPPMYAPAYRGHNGAYTVVIEKDHFGGGLIAGMLVAVFVITVLVFFNSASAQNNAQAQDDYQSVANERVYREHPAPAPKQALQKKK